MRTKLKKTACIALFLLMAGTMVFATGRSQQSAASGRQTLQIGMMSSPEISDYRNNYLTQYLEKLHDVDLTFYEMPPSGADYRTRISLLAAAGDLPETLWGRGGMSADVIATFGRNGAFLDLTSYFSDPAKTPYLNRIPQADRNVMIKTSAAGDGRNYGFPKYEISPGNRVTHRLYINREWLSKLGLQEPRTTEELRTVLRAFVNNDPNGNGRRDEMGVFGWYNGWYGQNTVWALINSFIYYNHSMIELDSTGNNVYAPFMAPAFRTALQYLNSLYREGLLDASTFTVDEQGFRAALNANPMVVGLTSTGTLSDFGGTANPSANLLAVLPVMAPLSSPISPGYAPYHGNSPYMQTFITSNAKNVDLAVKIMDSFYDWTLSMTVNYGEENVNWTQDPARLVGLTNAYVANGAYPRIIWAIDRNNALPDTHNKHWGDVCPTYLPIDETYGVGYIGGTPFDPTTPTNRNTAMAPGLLFDRHPQNLLPTLIHNEAEGEIRGQIVTNIAQYTERSIAEFITNIRDINSEAAWNDYLNNLNSLGVQRWLQIGQAAFNRQR